MKPNEVGQLRAKKLQLDNHKTRLEYAERMGFDESYIDGLKQTISRIEDELHESE